MSKNLPDKQERIIFRGHKGYERHFIRIDKPGTNEHNMFAIGSKRVGEKIISGHAIGIYAPIAVHETDLIKYGKSQGYSVTTEMVPVTYKSGKEDKAELSKQADKVRGGK